MLSCSCAPCVCSDHTSAVPRCGQDGVIDDPHKRNHLSMSKLDHLVNACNATGSRIVVSSYWRLMQPLYSRLLAVLRHLGLEVIGSTPVHPPRSPERPLEILEWLHAYNDAAASFDRPARERVSNPKPRRYASVCSL